MRKIRLAGALLVVLVLGMAMTAYAANLDPPAPEKR
jgi:hypothetical protein